MLRTTVVSSLGPTARPQRMGILVLIVALALLILEVWGIQASIALLS